VEKAFSIWLSHEACLGVKCLVQRGTSAGTTGGDDSDPSKPFPSGCKTNEMSPQAKALEFLFFDLSACVLPDTTTPVPPPGLPSTPPPATPVPPPVPPGPPRRRRHLRRRFPRPRRPRRRRRSIDICGPARGSVGAKMTSARPGPDGPPLRLLKNDPSLHVLSTHA
jgi:hypothetical protein